MEEVIKDYKGERQTPIRSIRNQFRKFRFIIKLRKKSGVTEPKGSSGGGAGEKKSVFTYLITDNIWNKSNVIYYRYSKYKTFSHNFNKHQLIGKIVTIAKKKYRIIR